MRPTPPPVLPPPALRLVAIVLLIVGGVAGCQQADTKPPPGWSREDVETLEMRPEWQRFVEENYRGVVIAHLNASPGVKFEEPPRAVATRNKSRSATELLAAGSADVPDAAGKVYRRPYTIVWRQSGGGWQPYDVRIDPGVPYLPPPVVPPKSPVTPPAASKPAA